MKPSREGSSVGVHICRSAETYAAAVEDAARLAGTVLVEQFVQGREVQGAVLDDAALGAIEIVPAHEFYDYEAKYTAGQRDQVPLPRAAAAGPVRPGERGLPRRPTARWAAAGPPAPTSSSPRRASVQLLELNTIPGMTPTSLLPKIAAGRGIDYPQLCERILLGASLKA